MSRASRFIVPVIWTLIPVAGITVLLIWNPTAREVIGDALGLAFAFFTTPFILETTCALLFLIGLLVWNRWRLHKEGDGWVYLMTQEPDEKNLPAKITQRLQSTVLAEKPETLDEAQAEAGIIEGYLDLGMAAQARQELDRDTTTHSRIEAALLRIRVLAANLDTDSAAKLLRDTAQSDHAAHPLLATVAIENARWLLKHVHHEDLARRWLADARLLDPAAFDSISDTEPLHRLV